jgi:hypothetical protein
MKKHLPLLSALFILVVITGCQLKDNDTPPVVTLVGKWQLGNDSISTSSAATAAVSSNYKGVSGDYFDFRTDGFCYTKEGTVYDTLSYDVISNKSVALQNFGLAINGGIESSQLTLTLTTANITTQNTVTPTGSTYFRTVNLSK